MASSLLSEDSDMSSDSRSDLVAARLIGVLFLAAFLTYGVGEALINSVTGRRHFLENISASETRILVGALLMLANSGCVIGIGALMFPVLRRHNERIALGYFGTRVFEAILLAFGVICYLALLWLGQHVAGLEHVSAGTDFVQVMSAMALKGQVLAYNTAMLFLAVGSVPMCYVLWQAKLVPRILAEFGAVGYAVFAVGSVLEMFGIPASMYLAILAGMFELGLPFWLLWQGFKSNSELDE